MLKKNRIPITFYNFDGKILDLTSPKIYYITSTDILWSELFHFKYEDFSNINTIKRFFKQNVN